MSATISSQAFWKERDLGLALAALAARLRSQPRSDLDPVPPANGTAPEDVIAACAHLGLECDEVTLHAQNSERILRSSVPAVLWIAEHGWLVVTRIRGHYAHVLTSESSVHKIPLQQLRRVLRERCAEPHRAKFERVLSACGIAPQRIARAADALLDARLHRQPLAPLFALRLPPGSNFLRQLRDAGVLRWFITMIAAHAGEYALLVAAWGVIGRAALQGRVDSAMLVLWLLLLAAMVPCRTLTTWAQGVVAVRSGALLRQRLLAGILKLKSEEVRHEGSGAFLARAIDADMVESLALSGGLASLLAIVELMAAALVLRTGNAVLELPLLALWCVGTAILVWRYWQRRRRWTDARLTMTHEQVELMVGHRTRLAQQPCDQWHLEEDRRLEAYLAASQAMDAQGARLEGLIPRSWFLVGVLGLAPVFLSAENVPAALAVSIGGVVLAWRALQRLTTGLANLSGAVISWKQIAPLFHAAARSESSPPSANLTENTTGIEARHLAYQYSGHSKPVIQDLELQIRHGEKILVQGPSGGGKSTLVALLAGLREPTAGTLKSGGLDRASLGASRWHRRVSAAPQYHENHVLTGTFAYNLLLGRRWPATDEDLREAEEVARDVGLGPVLDRMPGGLMEMVGETGWQLSSGERSRLFLCRALLSHAELVILDESFAALDPETLRQSLECSLRQTKSLLVVAHP